MSFLPPSDTANQILSRGSMILDLPPSVAAPLKAAFIAGAHFFVESPAEKLRNALPEDSGYRPLGREYSRSEDHPDQIESFTVSTRHAATLLPTASAIHLHAQMLAAMNLLEQIAESITALLAEAITGYSLLAQLSGQLHRWSRLQLNYSTPTLINSPHIHEEHEDGNLITLACSTAPGLELKMLDGSYLPLHTSQSQVIVMPGEILWLLSGGGIQPLWHRVVTGSAHAERLALLYFADLDPKACTPWKHTSLNYGIDIGARVLTNVNRFGLNGFSPE